MFSKIIKHRLINKLHSSLFHEVDKSLSHECFSKVYFILSLKTHLAISADIDNMFTRKLNNERQTH